MMSINGNINYHTEYMAFGEILYDEHTSDTAMPYLFNGKELQTETSLYDYGARFYLPDIGRWLNIDPMAEKYSNVSPYAYVNNNPIMLIDPTGMAPEDWYKRKNTDGTVNYRWYNNTSQRVRDKLGTIWERVDISVQGYVYKGIDGVNHKLKSDGSYASSTGAYKLNFTGKVVSSKEMTGKNLGSKHAQFGIEGTMFLNEIFDDGGVYTHSSYPMTSGPYFNGPTPNKNYTGSKFMYTNEDGMQIYNKRGWKIYLEDYNGRTGLRLHPDTNSKGTAGCIGIRYNASELNDLGTFLKKYIDTKGSIKINFQIPNTPNYSNEGRAVKNPGQ